MCWSEIHSSLAHSSYLVFTQLFYRAGDIVQFIVFAKYGKVLGLVPSTRSNKWVAHAWKRRKIKSSRSSFVDHVASLRLTWDAILRHWGWDKQREYYWDILGCEILFLEVGNVISAQEIHLSSLFITKTNGFMIFQKKSTKIIIKTVIKKIE